MDPVSQATVGALLTQTRSTARHLGKAAVIGALAGMAPDLDVLIRSDEDPLLFLEFHRQFTHSLLFIPFGGLLCALVFYPLLGRRWQLGFLQTWLWSSIGYATHGFLDGCTSYGTQLLWPLTDQRFAWDAISIVDPLFTLPLLALVILAARRNMKRYVFIGIAWGALYLSLGYIQQERAIAIGQQLAQQRGHAPLTLEAKPSFANLVVWKVIYATDTHYYVDAVRPGLRKPRIWEGDSIPRLDLARDLPWLNPDSQQARDIERFRWFSMGFIALDPDDPLYVIDVRYSLLPNQIKSLWGIRLSRDATGDQHVAFVNSRGDSRNAFGTLMNMIFK